MVIIGGKDNTLASLTSVWTFFVIGNWYLEDQ